MKIMSARSPRFTESGDINLDVFFEEIGEVQFTASPNDLEEHGRELFEWANAGEFGPVTDYVAPPITQKQVEAEARAYLASTDWYVVRKAETGEEIPADIADARQKARESVK